MKKSTLLKLFFGLLIVALGTVMLLKNIGVISGDIWQSFGSVFWGSALVIAGILAMSSGGYSWVIGLPLMIAGSGIVLRAVGLVDINMWRVFWPVMIISAGLALMLQIKPSRKKVVKRDKTVIFYSDESRVQGMYEGGSLTAIFGGIELDLTDADIKDGSVIDVTVFCGGIDIIVPNDVIVVNDVRGVLGESSDNRAPNASAKKKFHVRGESIMGSFEIRGVAKKRRRWL